MNLSQIATKLKNLFTRKGMTIEHDVRMGGNVFYRMKWVNGQLVSSSLIK